jgi:hypothetical protein
MGTMVEGQKYRPPHRGGAAANPSASSTPILISILGYRPYTELPLHVCIFPLYFIVRGSTCNECPARAGSDSIASLGQAVENLQRYALCSFIKSKDADPINGILMPLLLLQYHHTGKDDNNSNNNNTRGGDSDDPKNKCALCFLQMPFVEKFIPLSLPSLPAQTENAQQASSELRRG